MLDNFQRRPSFHLMCGFPQEPEDKVDKLLDIALKQFTQILAKGEESNLFAAHGAAAVLAEQATRANPPKIDYLLPAKRILDKVDCLASLAPQTTQVSSL